MPVPVDGVEMLQAYLRSVLADAEHHANNVDKIVLGLAGAIITRKDKGSPLQVRSGKSGGMGRALTVTIRGNRYALSYNHADHAIDLKAGSFQGDVVHKFTNETPLSEVAAVFAAL